MMGPYYYKFKYKKPNHGLTCLWQLKQESKGVQSKYIPIRSASGYPKFSIHLNSLSSIEKHSKNALHLLTISHEQKTGSILENKV